MNSISGKATAILRIALGAGFLYAGLEKALDLSGGGAFSAVGFLKFATGGTLPGSDPKVIVNPTHDLWVSLASNGTLMPIVNFLVVFGETAVGICLILGLATRFAGIMGALLTGLFFVASWSFANGIVNEQFLYAFVAAYLAVVGAGSVWGLDGYLARTQLLAKTPLKVFVA
jgi:thiosulfate dehydrogenase [quinone] large subunit